MNSQEIRDRQKNAPDWLAVEIIGRLEALEEKIAAMATTAPQPERKRGRPRKVKNGADNV